MRGTCIVNLASNDCWIDRMVAHRLSAEPNFIWNGRLYYQFIIAILHYIYHSDIYASVSQQPSAQSLLSIDLIPLQYAHSLIHS